MPERPAFLPRLEGKGHGVERTAQEEPRAQRQHPERKDVEGEDADPEKFDIYSRPSSDLRREEQAEEVMWRWRISQDMKELGLQLRASQAENKELKTKIEKLQEEKEYEQRFQTPEDEKAETRRPRSETKGASSSESRKGTGAVPKTEGNDKTVEFMMLMLQSMQEMQRHYMEDKAKGTPEVEVGGATLENGMQSRRP